MSTPPDKPVRIIPHEVIPGTGSYEVRYADGRPSIYVYFEDVASRRLRPEQLTRAQAIAQAQELARAEMRRRNEQKPNGAA